MKQDWIKPLVVSRNKKEIGYANQAKIFIKKLVEAGVDTVPRISDVVGVDQGTIRDILNNGACRWSTLNKIATRYKEWRYLHDERAAQAEVPKAPPVVDPEDPAPEWCQLRCPLCKGVVHVTAIGRRPERARG